VSFSAVGLFAKLVSGPALSISFGRAVFALSALLLLLAAFPRFRAKVDREDLPRLLFVSLLIAGNWGAYFAAIQVAGVAVAVVSLFTYPLLTAILEPYFTKEPHSRFELFAGLAVVGGVALVVPSLKLTDRGTLGVLLGVVSAVCFALRNIYGRPLVARYGSVPLMTWQFLFAAVAFLPFGLSGVGQWTARDLGLMFLLGALLTTLSQVLFLHSLKSVTSSTASLLTSAQPVVTVLLAFLFLGEVPTQRTLLGGAVISASVVAVALRQVRANL